jgi:hypothetical protein
VDGFTKASEIPIGTSTRIEDLELLLTQQDIRIAELEAENETLREADAPARPKRLSSDILKDTDRLILLARINDLTIANEALELEIRKIVDHHGDQLEILFSAVHKLKSEIVTGPIQPKQRDQGDILRALLITSNGKLPALEARRTMHMSKQAFSNLLKLLPDIEARPMKTDKRRRLLVLK